jgi:small multidrug resistance family-3 protein
MTVLRSVLLFVLAALAEIGGAWLVWQGVREHRGLVFVGAGILALGGYGFVATLQPDPHFGRILAAYGGVFVAGSLAWGMAFDGFRPERPSWPERPSAGSRRSGPASPMSTWSSWN